MGTHWKKNFDYKFTGAYELEHGSEKTLTIIKTGQEEVCGANGQKQVCFVAYFKESEKPMVLNKTNCKTIEKLYGPIIEDWIGKRITIKSESVKAFGEVVDALRVKKSKPFDKTIDYSSDEIRLRTCTTIVNLQSVYLALSPQAKAALLSVKDEMKKTILEGKGEN